MFEYFNNFIVTYSARQLHKKVDVPDYFLRYLFFIEDKRFQFHFGIDPIAISRAFVNNLYYGNVYEGASTITQQLYSTNLETKTEQYNRDLDGKFKQIIWSINKEISHSKIEILTEYLETIYWGRNYHGLDEAATGYFGISKQELSYEQSFFLAERIAWPNIINLHRIKRILLIPKISHEFKSYERLKNLSIIYNQVFQCKGDLCQILEK